MRQSLIVGGVIVIELGFVDKGIFSRVRGNTGTRLIEINVLQRRIY